MDLFELAVAKKLAGGGGGGGSSDFSTAKLTLVSTEKSPDGGGGAYGINILIDDAISSLEDFDAFLEVSPLDVILYKGHAIGTASSENMSVSGDVTWDADTGAIDIYGDCTISYVSIIYI